MKTIEEVYDDYLYDCHIANQQLTEEEWLYYGREEHHIEVPNRDGGILTPLNSQYLTTYQHWVAGVLQSEVLQKCCFMCIPANTLPETLDNLRRKWRSWSGQQSANTNFINQTGIYQSDNRRKGRETQKQLKIGIYDPEVQSRAAILGTARARELGVGLYDPGVQERGRIKGVQSTMKPIVLIHHSGLEEYFESMSNACRKYDLNGPDLSRVCKGKRKKCKGFAARYAD